MKRTGFLNVVLLILFALSALGQESKTGREVRFPELVECYERLDASLSLDDYRGQLAVADEKARQLTGMQQDGMSKKIAGLLGQTARRKALIKYYDVHGRREIFQEGQSGIDLDTLDFDLLTDFETIDFIDAYYGVSLWNKNKMEWASDLLFNVKDGRAREVYVLPVLRRAFLMNGYSKIVKELCENIGFCVETGDLRKESEKLIHKYAPLKPGSKAPDFSLTGECGTFQLLEFEGKMIYMIVWSLNNEQSEKELSSFMRLVSSQKHSFPVEFVTIAVNAGGDRKDWENFLRSNSYAGKATHLFCDREDPFVKKYLIERVPRYIFIEKDQTLRNAWFIFPSNDLFYIVFKEKKSNISVWNE